MKKLGRLLLVFLGLQFALMIVADIATENKTGIELAPMDPREQERLLNFYDPTPLEQEYRADTILQFNVSHDGEVAVVMRDFLNRDIYIQAYSGEGEFLFGFVLPRGATRGRGGTYVRWVEGEPLLQVVYSTFTVLTLDESGCVSINRMVDDGYRSSALKELGRRRKHINGAEYRLTLSARVVRTQDGRTFAVVDMSSQQNAVIVVLVILTSLIWGPLLFRFIRRIKEGLGETKFE